MQAIPLAVAPAMQATSAPCQQRPPQTHSAQRVGMARLLASALQLAVGSALQATIVALGQQAQRSFPVLRAGGVLWLKQTLSAAALALQGIIATLDPPVPLRTHAQQFLVNIAQQEAVPQREQTV